MSVLIKVFANSDLQTGLDIIIPKEISPFYFFILLSIGFYKFYSFYKFRFLGKIVIPKTL